MSQGRVRHGLRRYSRELPDHRMCPETRVTRRFCHCANVTEHTHTNLDGTAYDTARLWSSHCSQATRLCSLLLYKTT